MNMFNRRAKRDGDFFILDSTEGIDVNDSFTFLTKRGKFIKNASFLVESKDDKVIKAVSYYKDGLPKSKENVILLSIWKKEI